MKILGIETSCDETAAAVVDGNRVLSNVVHSQIADHAPYGGVVPEIASRRHVEHLPGVLSESLSRARTGLHELDGIAVTAGPGLAGALLAGITAAKTLSIAAGIPLIAVHHLQGHLASVSLGKAAEGKGLFPMLVLLVSGGHSGLVRVRAPGRQRWLGRTLDDAAGEALDKGATLMGLGYPGGPAIEAMARGGNPARFPFPRGRVRALFQASDAHLDPACCLSFSGLKTSLRYFLRDHPAALTDPATLRDVAAGYQEAVIDALCVRVAAALRRDAYASMACVGGVARNRLLRERLEDMARREGIPLLLTDPEFCTDNAAMIAAAAAAGLGHPVCDVAALDARPSWPLPERPEPCG